MKENSKKKFRILFIAADRYPPFRVDLTHLFAEELAKRGHTIDWILQSEEDCSSSYEEAWGGGTAFVGPNNNGELWLNRIKKNVYAFFHDFKMFSQLRKRDYDFLQVRDKYIIALPALLAAKMFKVKFVLWLSFPFPEAWIHFARVGSAKHPRFYYVRGTLQKLFLYKLLAPAANHIFLQSPEMKRMFIEQGVDEAKLTVVPMGYSSLDVKEQSGSDDAHLDDLPPLSVVYIGSLHRNRKIDFVLRTFYLVKEIIPEAKLYLVGAGEDKLDDDIISAECDKLNLQNSVELTGFIAQQKAFDYVRKAAVCISPIYPDPILNAGSPTKLVEYMAFGKAVVANEQLEQKLILEESGGGLCVPWEEQAYANAIIELLSDPEKASQMGQAGKRYIEKHRNYSNIASNVEKVYSTLCESSIH